MAFNRLSVYVSKASALLVPQLRTGGIPMLYSKSLKGESFDSYIYINIYFTSILSEENKTVKVGKFIDFYSVFDFNEFERIPEDKAKKKYLLDAMHNAAIALGNQENWDIKRFDNAYKECLDVDLKVEWNFQNKLFQSPNKRNYFSLLNIVEFGYYKIFEILYNNKKEELFRRECFIDSYPVFHIQWAAWTNDSEHFQYQFSGPKKIFTANLSDLVNRQCYLESREMKMLF